MKRIIGALLLGLILSSCEKALIPADPVNTQENNFDFFWKTLDEKYSYFNYKRVDWDSVYHIYRPYINNGMHDSLLFNILTEMIVILRDGHISLASPFYKVYWGWFLGAPANFNEKILLNNYLKNEYLSAGSLIYKTIDSVGYIYCNNLSESILPKHLDDIMDYMKSTKGIIVDIRNNAGGEVLYAQRIAARFNPKEKLVSYWLYKNGPGHNDFTEPVPYYLSSTGEKAYTKPVMLLVNRFCFSAANDLTLMFKALPNVTIIGDTTGGGGGVPMQTELPNGWILGFSTTQTLSPEKEHVENGIPPHLLVYMTEEDEKNSIDPLIETAFRKLK